MTGSDTRSEMGQAPRQLMLFACAANVCRSPAMEFLTVHHLLESDLEQSWRFMSAGTMASVQQRMCAQSASTIAELPGGAAFIQAHRSRPLTPHLISCAGLILVASRQERSVVVRQSPTARARTFTMVEAALLAESAAARDTASWRKPGPMTLDMLARLMRVNRGLIVADDPPGMGARPRRPRTIDIGDVHTGEVKGHGRVLSDVRWASEHLTRALVSLLGG